MPDSGHFRAGVEIVDLCRTVDTTDRTDVTHDAQPSIRSPLVSTTLSGSAFVPIMASRVQ
jgi:hypothetical protein